MAMDKNVRSLCEDHLRKMKKTELKELAEKESLSQKRV